MATRAKEPGVDFRDDQPAADAATLQADLRESLVNQYPHLADNRYPEQAVSPEELFMTFKEVVQQPENDYETVRETALLIAENLQGEPAAKIQDLAEGNLNHSEMNYIARRRCPETHDAVVAAAANIATFRIQEINEAIADALMADNYDPGNDDWWGYPTQELSRNLEQVANGALPITSLVYQDNLNMAYASDDPRDPQLQEGLNQYMEALQNHGAAQLQEILERNPDLSEKLAQTDAQNIAALAKAVLDYTNETQPKIYEKNIMILMALEHQDRLFENRHQSGMDHLNIIQSRYTFQSEITDAYQDAAQERRNYTEALLAADTLRQGGYPTPEPGLADFDTETQQYREWAWMMYPQSASAVYHDMQHRFEQTGDDPEKMLFSITPMIADLSVRSLLRSLDDMATGETPPSEKYAPETYSDPNVAADFDQNARQFAAASAEAIRQEISYLQHAAMRGDETGFVEHAAKLYRELYEASIIPIITDGIVTEVVHPTLQEY